METYEKIRYLSKIKNIELSLKTYELELEKIEKLKTRVKAIDYAKEKIQGSNKNSLENLIDKADEYKLFIIKNTNELLDCKFDIMNAIAKVKDLRCRALLEMRYVDCKEWNYICTKFNLERDSINKLHSKSLIYINLHTNT